MSIHFILGKPGGGKSRWAAEKLIEQLVDTDRVVFTNLPVNWQNLNHYLQTKYPKREINLFERLVELDDEQSSEFWTYRPPGLKMGEAGEYHRIARLTKEEWTAKKRPDYSGVKDKGVCYMIDEVHNHYNARSWMDTGRDVLYYNSQHRHLSDIVYFITQDLELVDKQFRFLAQDYCHCMNLSKVKVSFWKMPKMFVWHLRVSPAENSPVVETGTFPLDKDGIASTYYTTRLVKGGKADTEEKRKGIPWWVGLVALGVFLLAVFFILPKIVMKFVGGAISPKTPNQKQNEPSQNKETSGANHQNNDGPAAGNPSPELRRDRTFDESGTNEVRCLGYSAITKPAQAWFSDGTLYTGAFRVGANGILIGERIYRWASLSAEQPKQNPVNQSVEQINPLTITKVYVVKNAEGVVVGRVNRNNNPVVDDESNQTTAEMARETDAVRESDGGLRDNEPSSIPN